MQARGLFRRLPSVAATAAALRLLDIRRSGPGISSWWPRSALLCCHVAASRLYSRGAEVCLAPRGGPAPGSWARRTAWCHLVSYYRHSAGCRSWQVVHDPARPSAEVGSGIHVDSRGPTKQLGDWGIWHVCDVREVVRRICPKVPDALLQLRYTL